MKLGSANGFYLMEVASFASDPQRRVLLCDSRICCADIFRVRHSIDEAKTVASSPTKAPVSPVWADTIITVVHRHQVILPGQALIHVGIRIARHMTMQLEQAAY